MRHALLAEELGNASHPRAEKRDAGHERRLDEPVGEALEHARDDDECRRGVPGYQLARTAAVELGEEDQLGTDAAELLVRTRRRPAAVRPLRAEEHETLEAGERLRPPALQLDERVEVDVEAGERLLVPEEDELAVAVGGLRWRARRLVLVGQPRIADRPSRLRKPNPLLDEPVEVEARGRDDRVGVLERVALGEGEARVAERVVRWPTAAVAHPLRRSVAHRHECGMADARREPPAAERDQSQAAPVRQVDEPRARRDRACDRLGDPTEREVRTVREAVDGKLVLLGDCEANHDPVASVPLGPGFVERARLGQPDDHGDLVTVRGEQARQVYRERADASAAAGHARELGRHDHAL